MPAALTIGPPLVDVGLLQSGKRLRARVLAWWNGAAATRKPRANRCACQRASTAAALSLAIMLLGVPLGPTQMEKYRLRRPWGHRRLGKSSVGGHRIRLDAARLPRLSPR